MREWLIYYVDYPSNKPMNKTVNAPDILTALYTATVPFMWIKSIKEVSQ